MDSSVKSPHEILSDAGESLHYKEIARRVIADRLSETDGKTPEATVNAQLSIQIKKYGTKAKFSRVGPGVFSVNGAPSQMPESVSSAEEPVAANTTSVGQLSFTDAA